MREKVSSTQIGEPPPPPKKGQPPEESKPPSLEEALPKIMQACAEVFREAGGEGHNSSFGVALVFDADAAFDDSAGTYDVPAVEGGLSTIELSELWKSTATAAGEGLWLLACPFRQCDSASASKLKEALPSVKVAMYPDPDGELIGNLTLAGMATPSWSRLYAYEVDPAYGMISMPEDPEVFELLMQHTCSCPVFEACQDWDHGRRFLQIGNEIPDEMVSAFGCTVGNHFENLWREKNMGE